MSIATESFRVERVRVRVRAMLGGAIVLDTSDARMLFEPRRMPVYLFPRAALDPRVVETSETVAEDRTKGPSRHATLRVGDRVATDAVVEWPEAQQAELAGLVAVRWDAMDRWFHEDEEVHVHARNPYHRVDAYASSRHVEVFADGVKIADTRRPVIVYETDLPPRYYVPKLDVRMDLLTHVERRTGCPYKGFAGYYDVKTGGSTHRATVWEYATPFAEMAKIAGLLAFYQEKLEVRVDGERV